MSSIRVTYEGRMRCTARHEGKLRTVATDACLAAGGRGEELSPGELVATGLAGRMLLSMGVAAARDRLDIRGTTAQVTTRFKAGGGGIEEIDVAFELPGRFSQEERSRLRAAADACPIKHSFRSTVRISESFRCRGPVREEPERPRWSTASA